MDSFCIIGISGYSGSGKTTLIRNILPALKKDGLCVGVLKHVHHTLDVDARGKDTDLFYRAGADYVLAHDARQCFMRFRDTDTVIQSKLGAFPSALDLLIIEGHKELAVPGIWLEPKSAKGRSKTGNAGKQVISRDDPKYVQKVHSFIREEMARFHADRIIYGGLLVGGKSVRMGSPKTLLKIHGRTLAGRSFHLLSSVTEKTVLLGAGKLPASMNAVDRLADVPYAKGPLAGMLSAFRWSPDSAWIISSVDMPMMNQDAWEWLSGQRGPGRWAVLPRLTGGRGVETTGAVYEPMIFEYVESLARKGITKLQEIAKHPKVFTPLVPKSLQHAWKNVNTPSEWKRVIAL